MKFVYFHFIIGQAVKIESILTAPGLAGRRRAGVVLGSGGVAAQFLFHAFQFLAESLVPHTGTFAPRFAFRIRLCGISGDFAAVNILVTFSLALEFCAQFIFRHMQYLN